MYYLLLYDLVDNYKEKRAPLRDAHIEKVLASRSNGEFLMGGAFDDEKQAALVFKTDSLENIEDFAKTDPYVTQGLVKNWTIRKWNVAVTWDSISL